MMNENNNFNNGVNQNPGMPTQDMGMNQNPGMPMQDMGMNQNPGMPVQDMGMNQNPGMPAPMAQPVKPKNKKLPLIIGISAAVVVVAVVVILLVFGGKKSLTCKQEQSIGMGMTMTTTTVFKFEKKDVSSADMVIEVGLGSYSSFKDTFIEQFEEEYASFAAKGLDVEITSDDSNIYIKFSADKQKFSAAGISTSGTYKNVKSDMETQGFVCE